MGKQAATKVRAGAEGTGATGKVFPEAPALRLVSSPKRQRILEGMLEAVGNAGYDAASVRMVLDQTGLYRQAFYDEFADKDACYLEALDYGVAKFEAIARAAAEPEEGWRAKLRAGLGAAARRARRGPRDRPRADRRGPRGGARGAENSLRSDETRSPISSIRRATPRPAPRSPPPIAAEGIVAGMHAVVHAKLATGDGDGFRELLPDFMYFAVLPYFGAEVAGAEMKAARA